MINSSSMSSLPFYFMLFILLITIYVLIDTFTLLNNNRHRDNFQNPKQKVVAKDTYDNFYAPVYTTLISDMIVERTKYEVYDLIEKTNLENYPKANLLDIGCGGGDHLKWLAKEDIDGLQLTGIDKSEAMLSQTKERIGKVDNSVRLIHKDIYEDDLFERSSFSHITCYYFTIYYINSKEFIKNIIKLLKPKGWFVIHMVDLEKFDPILDAANPFRGIDPQKYVKNRITESSVHFKKFIYKANFTLKKNKALFDEAFHFKETPKIRTQRHILKRIDTEKFINQLGKLGLELKNLTNLDGKGYREQNILYFQKS